MVVARGVGHVDILRLAHVDPVNHGLATEDVVAKIDAWHRAYGVDVIQADVETVHVRFLRLPTDPTALAADIVKFCPDIGHPRLVQDLRSHSSVTLWWD